MRITDFGIARKWSPDNAKETSGTPGYMAPEVMCRQNHGIEVDYFALGVICFECMKGRVRENFLRFCILLLFFVFCVGFLLFTLL